MDYPKYFNPKNSLKLFGLEENFNFLSSIYSKHKLPKVLMLSGLKGTGKSTLINHLSFQYLMNKIIIDQNILYRMLLFFTKNLERVFFKIYYM